MKQMLSDERWLFVSTEWQTCLWRIQRGLNHCSYGNYDMSPWLNFLYLGTIKVLNCVDQQKGN